MQYLPSFLCHIIDAVAYKGDPLEWKASWNDWKAQFQEYYQRESDYQVSEEDAQIVANLPPLLEQLSASVERAFTGKVDLEDLVKDSLSFFQAHDAFYEERERPYFVHNSSLDRLLKASVAHLQGRAGHEAIHAKAPEAVLAVATLSDLYMDTQDVLPEDFKKGCLEGFRRAQKGFDMLAEHEAEFPTEVLEEALFELRSAGELLEHLPTLYKEFEEENSLAIPIVGSLLSALRHEESEENWALLQENAFPAFLELWEKRQDGWLLHPEVAADLLETAEGQITLLSEMLEEGPPENLEEFWSLVDALDEVFARFPEHTLDLEALRASPFWPEAQMILNLLRGGAPIYAARTLIDGVRGSDAPPVIQTLADDLDLHLETGDPIPLLHSLVLLQEDLELSKTSRPCASCPERVPLEAKECPSCGAQVEELSISG